MKIRKNKYSTTIQVEEFTPQEFRRVQEAYQSIDDNKVIKAKRQTAKEYFEIHSRPLSDCEAGDTYRVLGLFFEVKKVNKKII